MKVDKTKADNPFPPKTPKKKKKKIKFGVYLLIMAK